MKSYLESNGAIVNSGQVLDELESLHTQLSAQLQTQYDDHITQLNAEVDSSETNALTVIAQQLTMATTDMVNTRENAKQQIISTGAVTQGLLNGTITQANAAKVNLENEIATSNAAVTTLQNAVQTGINSINSQTAIKINEIDNQGVISKQVVITQEVTSTANVQAFANNQISSINNAAALAILTLDNQLTTNLGSLNSSYTTMINALNQKMADVQAIINQAVTMGTEDIKVGAIIYTANTQQWFGVGGSTPKWLLCDGQAFDSTTYPALFNFLQSGFTPNLNNQFVRCITLTTGRASLSTQAESVIAHSHAVGTTVSTTVNTTIASAGSHTHDVTTAGNTTSGVTLSRTGTITSTSAFATQSAGAHTHTATSTATSTGTSVCADQNGGGTETRPANIALFAVIRAL